MKILPETAVVWLVLFNTGLLSVAGAELGQSSRDGKLFSIFSLIQFPNSECTDANGDCGTCLTGAECSSQGGSGSGTCASGFGSCCLFFSDTCGGTISRNRTYIRNPGYSSSYSTAGTCTWTLAKSQTNICQIRLDFDESSISQPSNAAGVAGDCSTVDYFRGTPVTGKPTPYMCGENAGEHMYIDAGAYSSSEAILSAAFVGTATARKWKIKVSMVECGSLALPPQGCLQHHTGIAGQVRSFNFNSNSYQHLTNQNYQACIRRETGYCSIGWTQSSDTDSFKVGRPLAGPNTSFNTIFPANDGNSDYVVIPNGSDGGAGQCIATAPPGAGSGPVPSVDYYGGGSLNCNRVTATNAEIISSTVPFTLGVMFNNGEPAAFMNRGFCLNYRQIACDG